MIRYTLPVLLILGGVAIGLAVPRIIGRTLASQQVHIIMSAPDGWFDPRYGVELQVGEGQKWQVGDRLYRTRDLMGRNI